MNKNEIINKLKKLIVKINFSIITNSLNNNITISINDYVDYNEIRSINEKVLNFIKDNKINGNNYNEYYEILNILNYDSDRYDCKKYEELLYLNFFIDEVMIIINDNYFLK